MKYDRDDPEHLATVEPIGGLFEQVEAARPTAEDVRQGEARRDAVLDDLRARRSKILAHLDPMLRALYRSRVEYMGEGAAEVTVVDARAVFRASTMYDASLDLRFLGAVFRSKGWRATGRRQKQVVDGNHARPIETWRLA
jgi:hypothetical protein